MTQTIAASGRNHQSGRNISARQRALHLGSLTAGAAFVALSVGMPNGCEDPSPGATVLTRDNIVVGGVFDIQHAGVSSTVKSPYLTDGTWKNLTGHVQIIENRQLNWKYNSQFTPVLPGGNFSGPGSAQYGTRAGTMVHGNSYEVNVLAYDTYGQQLTSSTLVKLSDDTLVVPVVTISWKRPGADPSFVNEFYQSLNMFDYNPTYVNNAAALPYYLPDNTKISALPSQVTNPLLLSQIDAPSFNFFTASAPDKEEIPPDDIWASCGIQFQVVAQFIADLPANWQNYCNDNALNFPQPQPEVYKQLSGTPAVRDYLVNDLKPVYISYGDLSLCTSGFGNSFWASTPGMGRNIEVDYHRPRNTTSHELGHSLGLMHAYQNGVPVNGNLMRADGPGNDKQLTPDQCATARNRAKVLSDRYDKYNRAIGRTYSATVPPPPTSVGSAPGDSGDGDFDPGNGGEQTCCQGAADAIFGPTGSCPGKELPVEKCEQVCCRNGKTETLYLCEAQGTTGAMCVPH